MGLLVSTTALSEDGVLAGSFLFFSFFAAVGFGLSGAVSWDWVGSAAANGIVITARRRTARILMLSPEEKNWKSIIAFSPSAPRDSTLTSETRPDVLEFVAPEPASCSSMAADISPSR